MTSTLHPIHETLLLIEAISAVERSMRPMPERRKYFPFNQPSYPIIAPPTKK